MNTISTPGGAVTRLCTELSTINLLLLIMIAGRPPASPLFLTNGLLINVKLSISNTASSLWSSRSQLSEIQTTSISCSLIKVFKFSDLLYTERGFIFKTLGKLTEVSILHDLFTVVKHLGTRFAALRLNAETLLQAAL